MVRKTHELKCWPQYFELIASGEKLFEIRYNDREFQAGDILVIQEWDPKTAEYLHRTLRMLVTHITAFQQQPGWVVLGLRWYYG